MIVWELRNQHFYAAINTPKIAPFSISPSVFGHAHRQPTTSAEERAGSGAMSRSGNGDPAPTHGTQPQRCLVESAFWTRR